MMVMHACKEPQIKVTHEIITHRIALIAMTRWTDIKKVPNMESYTLGALQTLPHYKKISPEI